MIMKQALDTMPEQGSDKLDLLRQRINDEKYLRAAIQRLALVLSNELMGISSKGGHYERKRRK